MLRKIDPRGTSRSWDRVGYRPELDGLRALAVLAVFGSHTGWGPLAGGWIGVGVFFVLSGYLITTILLREWAAAGRLALGRFYVRRARRLYPALLVLLVGCAFFAPFFGDGGTAAGYVRTALYTGLYVQDLVAGFTGDTHGAFLHTWSLAVEEQFYLIWPLVLILVLRRGGSVLRWALAGTTVSWLLLVLTTQPRAGGPPATYVLPWTRAGELLLGCAVAAWLAGREKPFPVGISRWFPLGVPVVALAGLGLLGLTIGPAGMSTWMPAQIMAVALLTGALVVALAAGPGPITRLLSLRPLVGLGRISYGFYLFHLPLMMLVGEYTGLRWAAQIALTFALTLACAALSYRFVERRFLDRRPGAEPAPPAAPEVSASR
ncbi:acyltransferase family protein [Spongisporangium articulatum]|uniref:Acyltransferase family protein n=1 Tax=Spongisporangium articulatum TaxID=3362603 RepID=A0ABW8ALI2_9ACTN